MAHIKRRTNGRWQARFVDPGDHRERARDFATKSAAQRWLDQVTSGMVTGSYADPRSGRITVGDLAERWYATTAALKPTTRNSYRSLLDEHVLPRWGDAELRTVAHSSVAIWTAELSASRSASTTRKALGVLRGVLALAVADHALAVNPAIGVPQPRVPATEQRFLDAGDVDRLAEQTICDRDRILVLTLAWTGLRFGEAAGLVRSDVDPLRRRIRVERAVAEVRGQLIVGTTKTHAARTVAVPGFLADELGAYMAQVPDGVLFPSATGGRLSVTTWKRRRFDPAARAAGLTPPRLRIHDLRHTAAALSIASGASVKLVQRQLGHLTATMTLDVYGHLFPDDLEALSGALDGLRARAATDISRTTTPMAEVATLWK